MTPFIAADQLLAHAVGDYVLQSDWMANEKTKHSAAAVAHALTYGACFLVFRPSLSALAVVVGTHFAIDRFRLARFVVFAKNFLAPRYTHPGRCNHSSPPGSWWPTWSDAAATGYPSERPAWLSVWLLIIADNIMHVAINGAALRWL